MVSISSSVRGISRTFYTPLYEKEMVKMITKLKKTIIRLIFKTSILELKSQGATLEDIKIDIVEIDGEVYGKLEMFNVIRYYSKDRTSWTWQFNQNRLIEIKTDGWKLYFNEEMDEAPETF